MVALDLPTGEGEVEVEVEVEEEGHNVAGVELVDMQIVGNWLAVVAT